MSMPFLSSKQFSTYDWMLLDFSSDCMFTLEELLFINQNWTGVSLGEFSCNRLQTHHKPDLDKAVIEDAWKKKKEKTQTSCLSNYAALK